MALKGSKGGPFTFRTVAGGGALPKAMTHMSQRFHVSMAVLKACQLECLAKGPFPFLDQWSEGKGGVHWPQEDEFKDQWLVASSRKLVLGLRPSLQYDSR